MSQMSLLHIDGNGNIRNDLKCTACRLADDPKLQTNCMPGVGPTNPELMFVGWAPAAEDDARGIPMTGRNGRVFRELLNEVGIDPEAVFITNMVKCCPFDGKTDQKIHEACKLHLLKEIRRIKPTAIVSVGAKAFSWLSGQSGMKKYKRSGIPCKFFPELNVYPITQPAAMFHGDEFEQRRIRREILEDLSRVYDKAISGNLVDADEVGTDYQYAKSLEDIERFMTEFDAAEEVAVDLETGTVDREPALFPEEGTVIVAFGFSTGPGHGRAIPLYAWGSATLHYWEDDELEVILNLLKERLKTKKLFGQNWLQFDQKWIKHVFDIPRTNVVFDTMIAHHLIDEERGTHDLEQLAVRYARMAPWKKTFNIANAYQLCNYLCKDVDATYRVKLALEKELTAKQKLLLKDELIPLAHELMEMEYRGVVIQEDNLDKLQGFLHSKIQEEMTKLRAIPEVKAYEVTENISLNVNKHRQLGKVMEQYLKLPRIMSTHSGEYSTSKFALDELKSHPFVSGVLVVRGLEKLRGTYCDGLKLQIKRDGRVHTNYMIPGTVTGRLSSNHPNLQNIPREDTAGQVLEDGQLVKKLFSVPSGYCLLEADYSQIELRVLAMYSKDPKLIEIFETGQDVHRATAAEAYGVPPEKVKSGQRTAAKIINFGVVYGMGEESLIYKFVQAGSSEKEAKRFLQLHHQKFATVWDWVEKQGDLIRHQGFQETFFGRRRRYQWIDKHAMRQASNFPIQSTASEFTLISIVRTARALRKLELDAFPVLTVHDSILFQINVEQFWDSAKLIKLYMEDLKYPFVNVPIKVDLKAGHTWGSLKKVDVEKELIK
jgi:DNA polymerase I